MSVSTSVSSFLRLCTTRTNAYLFSDQYKYHREYAPVFTNAACPWSVIDVCEFGSLVPYRFVARVRNRFSLGTLVSSCTSKSAVKLCNQNPSCTYYFLRNGKFFSKYFVEYSNTVLLKPVFPTYVNLFDH